MEAEGLGGLDLLALRDSNTIAVMYGAFNASSRITGTPTVLATTLRAHLHEWRRAEGLTSCPLATPSGHIYVPSASNSRAGRGAIPRLQLALQAAGKALHDKAAIHPLGRCRDIPLSLAPCILDGSDNLLGHGPLSAEFQHL